jgi:hypothetical protein
VKKLRRCGIQDLEAATTFLTEHYWPEHNARFTRLATAPEDVHRRAPTARQLDQVFHLEETRTVGDDWMVRYRNRLVQLERQSGHPPARSTVTVYEWRDGRLAIEYRGRSMKWHDWSADPTPPLAARPGPPVAAPRKKRLPFSDDHPWRRREGDQGNRRGVLWRAMDQ